MKNKFVFRVIQALAFVGCMTSALAQQLSVPDAGLSAAIRDALRKPNGPLTEQDLLSLTNLDASSRNISSLDGLEAARNLVSLNLLRNQLTSVIVPASMTNLNSLFIQKNILTNLVLSPALFHLAQLDVSENGLTSFSLPAGLTNLSGLFLRGNQLTNVTLPADLIHLESLDLGGNPLTNLTLPSGLTNLSALDLTGDQLTSLTLPPDMTQLTSLLSPLSFDGNSLTTLVLSEPLAATNLAESVATLQTQGVSVFTYPLTIQLSLPRRTEDGEFHFAVVGPPGVYAVLGSVDLAVWNELAVMTNTLGFARFDDAASPLSPQKFYLAHSVP